MSAEKTTFAFTNYKLKSNVMKKMLLLGLAILGVATGVFAIEIHTDKLELNGNRVTKTYLETCANKGITVLKGGLMKETIDGIDKWYLCLQVTEQDKFFTMHKDRLLLIKLNDGSIIELKNIYNLDETDNKTEVHTVIGGTQQYTLHRLYPEYEVTKDQLLKITQIGAEKIRIELDNGYEDWNAGKKFSDFIVDSYKTIQSQCRIKNDVYYNF